MIPGAGADRAFVVFFCKPNHARHGAGQITSLGRLDHGREVRAGGQASSTAHSRERRHGLGRSGSVQKAGDALAAHRLERGRRSRQVLRLRRLGQKVREHCIPGIFEQAGGFAVLIAPDFAADWIWRRGRDLGEGERAGVGQRSVPERRDNENRPRRFQRIECGAVRLDSGRSHALLEPTHHLEPGIRVSRRRTVEARLNSLLHFGNRERFVVQTALQELQPGFERMHVAIDQAGHEESSLQVYRRGGRADKGRNALITYRRRQFAHRESPAPRRFVFVASAVKITPLR